MGAFPQVHECPPKYHCLDRINYGDDWEEAYTIYAFDPERAAIEGAELMDENGGDRAIDRRIEVKDVDGKITIFDIWPEIDVYYRSREVKP